MARDWMPIDWGDYLKDTQDLSTIEHGAYLLLIAHYWNTRTPLPNNDDKLRRITRTTTKEWGKMKGTIRGFFTELSTELHHGRIDHELERAAGVSTSQSSNAQQRWKKKEIQGPTPCGGKAAAMPPTPTPIETPNKHLTPTESASAPVAGVLKNGFSGGKCDIISLLNDKGLAAARDKAPGWDIYHLAGIYNEGVNSGRRAMPDKPNLAFPAWCAKYTKGNAP